VLGKIGRAETATDPAPLTMIETTIILAPQEEWPKGVQIEDIIRDLDGMVQLPGVTNAWTMPIKTRIDMLATGIKTPVGIKLLGDDLETLSEVGAEIEGVLNGFPGTASVYSERVVGGNYLNIRIRRGDAARYGLNVADIQAVVQSAIGGMNVSETVEGLERYPINVRFPRELRNDLATLRGVAVPTPMGHTVPLAQVADIDITKGPPAIKSENARRTAWIYVDLTTSDIGGYVESARRTVEQEVRLPAGVSIVWSGQYEYMERANRRLAMVVPLTLAVIVILLYAHFRRAAETGIVMLGTILFAPLGGIWLLYIFGRGDARLPERRLRALPRPGEDEPDRRPEAGHHRGIGRARPPDPDDGRYDDDRAPPDHDRHGDRHPRDEANRGPHGGGAGLLDPAHPHRLAGDLSDLEKVLTSRGAGLEHRRGSGLMAERERGGR
jgi:Cu(I)/Ag(I) efflux system membrane protein CusA/SilA